MHATPSAAETARAIDALTALGHDAPERGMFHDDLTVKAYAVGGVALVIEGRGRTDVVVVAGPDRDMVAVRSHRHAYPVSLDGLREALATGTSCLDLAARAARRVATLMEDGFR